MVPVGKKVRILITANDVIHAWWVPAFGVKQDAIPGFVRDSWFKVDKPGIYRGQCAELCGKEHGFMPIVVEVEAARKSTRVGRRPEGKKARRGRATTRARSGTCRTLKAQGEKVYAANCVACHQADRQGHAACIPGARRLEDRARARRPRRSTSC